MLFYAMVHHGTPLSKIAYFKIETEKVHHANVSNRVSLQKTQRYKEGRGIFIHAMVHLWSK